MSLLITLFAMMGLERCEAMRLYLTTNNFLQPPGFRLQLSGYFGLHASMAACDAACLSTAGLRAMAFFVYPHSLSPKPTCTNLGTFPLEPRFFLERKTSSSAQLPRSSIFPLSHPPQRNAHLHPPHKHHKHLPPPPRLGKPNHPLRPSILHQPHQLHHNLDPPRDQ